MNSIPQSRTRWICPQCGLMNRGTNRCRSCSYEYQGMEKTLSPVAARAPQSSPSPSSAPVTQETERKTPSPSKSSYEAKQEAQEAVFCELCQQPGLRSLGGDGLLWQCESCDQLVWTGQDSSITSSGFRKATKSRTSQNLRNRKYRKEATGWARIWEIASSYGFLLSMAAMALIAAITVATLLSIRNTRQAPQRAQSQQAVMLTDDLARRAPWAATQESSERVRKMAFAYIGSTRAEEIASLVIDGQQQVERIQEWLLQPQAGRPVSSSSIAGMRNLRLDRNRVEHIEGDWWRIFIVGQTSENLPFEREIVMEITEESVRIDWPASAGIGQISWEELLLERPQIRGKSMRVLIEPARPPSNSVIPFVAQELNAYPMWIYPAGQDKLSLVSYISKGSRLANALEAQGVQLDILDEDGRPISVIEPQRLILLLSFPPQGRATAEKTPRVNIERIVRNDWLSYASRPQQQAQEAEGEEAVN